MPAPPSPALRTAPAPFAGSTHLELRFGEPASGLAWADAPAAAGGSTPAPATAHAELDAVLDRAGLARVKTLEVALGERDLVPAAAASVARLIEGLPALRRLTLRFAGAPDPDGTALAAGLCKTRVRRRLAAVVEFALDGDANAFDALDRHARTPPLTSLIRVLEASRRLRTEGVAVRWMVPATPALVYRLEALFSLARDTGVDAVLAPAGCAPPGGQPALDGEDRLFLADFITHRLLAEGTHHPAGAPARAVAVLYAAPTGQGFRWVLDGEDRPAADGPRRGAWTRWRARVERTRAGRLARAAIGVGAVLLEGSGALVEWALARSADLMRARCSLSEGRRLTRVLLIGAYGGEHIGDAAILGGVLHRINRRYGTTDAVVMSQRPAHTRHLVSMLDTPFTVEVEAYERAAIRALVPRVDAVVFAGGPLIDLPRQLVKHLYAVARARRAGKPFIAEGIGPGPFPRWPSEWTARRIVGMAERISVRTSADAASRLLTGLAPDVGRDPAFDYLATRGRELTRLRARDRRWIERLLRDTDGRFVVGVNLRPIRHLFTVGVSAMKRAEFTHAVEARFEERLADGLRRFHQASPVAPCFVFFPMNAIQFGMSDLRSAYRLQRLLRGDVDFRVWEADASLDGIVALLREISVVVAMRFHAAIFALAEERRVIGIDYRVGERDKVDALLGDAGQRENCCRIDEMTSEWLLERLLDSAASSGAGRAVLRDSATTP